MIKKKSYWILMLTAICILAVTGCKKEGKTADFHIYYTDSEGVSLVEKGIKPEGKTQKEQIDEILDKIQKNTDDIDYAVLCKRGKGERMVSEGWKTYSRF